MGAVVFDWRPRTGFPGATPGTRFDPRTTNVPFTRTWTIAVRVLRRLLERRAVDDLRGIEDDDVRVRARLHASLVLHVGIDALESFRGKQSHLPHRVHERDDIALADEAAEDARVGTGAAGMADRLAILDLETRRRSRP